ncbi:hypothetical protein PV379_03320 [Streptomyces caniscabiei]|uniref:hypothetical protein n=1 Tax=Streptomyces caniscabiei TaxID=2746961 RepID=UPI0029B3C21E|nr:hypothetical protein [Streptomyces caniscabiei]MDX2776372.1 hypothetical protein [Streptomyces caniscabiei]
MSEIIGRVSERRLNPDIFFVPQEEEAIEEVDLKFTNPGLGFGFASYRVTVTDRLPGAQNTMSIDYLVMGAWGESSTFTAHTIIKMALRPAKGAVDIDRMPELTAADDIEHIVIVRAINERCRPTHQDPTPPFEDRRPV